MAMACFALLDAAGLPMAYAGGLLLGLGWAVFYMLAPILLIHCLKPKARLEALTLLSGSQMLGMGLAAPLGHFLARQSGRVSAAFAAYAACCAIAAGVAWLLRRSRPPAAAGAQDGGTVAVRRGLRAAREDRAAGRADGHRRLHLRGAVDLQSLYAQSGAERRHVLPDLHHHHRAAALHGRLVGSASCRWGAWPCPCSRSRCAASCCWP